MIACLTSEEEVTATSANVTMPEYKPPKRHVTAAAEEVSAQSGTVQVTFWSGNTCDGSADTVATHPVGTCDTATGQTYSCDGSKLTSIDWETYQCTGKINWEREDPLNQCIYWNDDYQAIVQCLSAEEAANNNITSGPMHKHTRSSLLV